MRNRLLITNYLLKIFYPQNITSLNKLIFKKNHSLNEHYRFDGLLQLIKSLKNKHLTEIGKFVLKRSLAEAQQIHKAKKKYYINHPEVHDYKIKKPIFIIGFPRSGTTFLHNLLIDTLKRDGLKFWELTYPIPRINLNCIDVNYRKLKTTINYTLYRMLVPDIQKMHNVKINSYEECWHLFKSSLNIFNLDLQIGIKNYGDYLIDKNMDDVFKNYKELIKIINHQKKKQLIFKCPEHLLFIDSLYRIFPDGQFIWIHRDPYKCIQSYSPMIHAVRELYLGRINKEEISQYIIKRFLKMNKVATNHLKKIPSNQIRHIKYEELKQNPLLEIKKIKKHFFIDNNNEHIEINTYNKLKTKRNFDFKDYRIDKKRVHNLFKKYIDDYAVPIKS